MGMDRSLPIALAKAKMAVSRALPTSGQVFLSIRDSDKIHAVEVARSLVSMGFTVFTTRGTRDLLSSHSVDTQLIRKISEGARPTKLPMVKLISSLIRQREQELRLTRGKFGQWRWVREFLW